MTSPRSVPSADVPPRSWRVTLTDGEGIVSAEGRLKLDEGWLIVTDRDEDGPYVVFAAPSESVVKVESGPVVHV